MSKLLPVSLLLFFFTFTMKGKAQTPTSCFEIESILVDACSPPFTEGQNEMVRFKVGPNQLDASNLTVSWPNNSWGGVIQNQQTADSVNYLNSTIQGCGFLIEPPSFILPAGAEVILVTAYNFNASSNNFTNLNDTIYILFQNSTTSSGHFKNACSSPCGSRTLAMSFSPPGGCTDTVVYYPDSLSSSDGAKVNYTWAGAASYVNDGCQAPFQPFSISATAGGSTSGCTGDTINMSGSTTGQIDSTFWWGGSGSFTQPDSLQTGYVIGSNDSGATDLYFSVITVCNDTLTDTVTITASQYPQASIALSGNDSICQGNSVTLTAQGGSSYSWSTGAGTQSITVSSSGTYGVEASNTCGIDSAYQTITVMQQPNAGISAAGGTTLCPGDSVTLAASGGDSYTWSNGMSGDSITVGTTGTYYAIASNNCGSDTSGSIAVASQSPPSASISLDGDSIICEGASVNLTANGNGNYLWSTGETSSSITVTSTGSYWLEVSNACGSDTARQNVTVIPIEAAFTATPTSGLVSLDVAFTNNSQNADHYDWDFGDGSSDTTSSPGHTYNETGQYEVILTATNNEGCSDTAVFRFIEVSKETYIEIPNVFSPNGDGTNDGFLVKGSGISDINGKIFNRWGQLLFEWNNIATYWDGTTYEGVKVPEGQYLYLIEVNIGNSTETYKGVLTLIR